MGQHQFNKAMTKYTIAQKDYEVNDNIINKAKGIYQYRKKKITSNIKKNTLYFIGMGMQFTPQDGFLNNHRIIGCFKNNEGILCFVEFGTALDNNFLRCDHALMGYETKEEIRIKLENLREYTKYTKEEVLSLVNKYFNCSFKELEILEYFVSCDDITSISEGV